MIELRDERSISHIFRILFFFSLSTSLRESFISLYYITFLLNHPPTLTSAKKKEKPFVFFYFYFYFFSSLSNMGCITNFSKDFTWIIFFFLNLEYKYRIIYLKNIVIIIQKMFSSTFLTGALWFYRNVSKKSKF